MARRDAERWIRTILDHDFYMEGPDLRKAVTRRLLEVVEAERSLGAKTGRPWKRSGGTDAER
jgi:hypothetical protein